MSVNSVNNNYSELNNDYTANSKAIEKANESGINGNTTNVEAKASTATTDAAVYEKSDSATSNINSPFDKEKIDSIIKQTEEQKTASFQKLIDGLIQTQATKSYEAGNETPIGLKDFLKNIQVDPETQAQAQKEISDDGYYGVDKTAGRILDFAKAIAGDDAEKFETMKNSVIKGFDEAAKVWGDELPEISQKTYDKVMQGFDEWEQQLNATNEVEQQAAASGIVSQ